MFKFTWELAIWQLHFPNAELGLSMLRALTLFGYSKEKSKFILVQRQYPRKIIFRKNAFLLWGRLFPTPLVQLARRQHRSRLTNSIQFQKSSYGCGPGNLVDITSKVPLLSQCFPKRVALLFLRGPWHWNCGGLFLLELGYTSSLYFQRRYITKHLSPQKKFFFLKKGQQAK